MLSLCRVFSPVVISSLLASQSFASEAAALEDSSSMRPVLTQENDINRSASSVLESDLFSCDASHPDPQNLTKVTKKKLEVSVRVLSDFNLRGSGVILDRDKGYILTNHHVIAGQEGGISISLYDSNRFNNASRPYEAIILGSDKATDVAILKVDVKKTPQMRCATFSSNVPYLRQGVTSIGSPHGLGFVVTDGYIFDTRSEALGVPAFMHNSMVNRGGSGGAVFNSNAEIVGINFSVFSYMPMSSFGRSLSIGSGYSYAIPAEVAFRSAEQIIEYGEVIRGYAGFSAVNIPLREQVEAGVFDGAKVTKVERYSPAEVSGLKVGDYVRSVSGNEIIYEADIREALLSSKPGQDLKFIVLRGDKKLEINLITTTEEQYLAELKKVNKLAETRGDLGVSVGSASFNPK